MGTVGWTVGSPSGDPFSFFIPLFYLYRVDHFILFLFVFPVLSFMHSVIVRTESYKCQTKQSSLHSFSLPLRVSNEFLAHIEFTIYCISGCLTFRIWLSLSAYSSRTILYLDIQPSYLLLLCRFQLRNQVGSIHIKYMFMVAALYSRSFYPFGKVCEAITVVIWSGPFCRNVIN